MDGSSGRGQIWFNTPGRMGVRGGQTPRVEQQPLDPFAQPSQFLDDLTIRMFLHNPEGLWRPRVPGAVTPPTIAAGSTGSGYPQPQPEDPLFIQPNGLPLMRGMVPIRRYR